jgi:L-asparaginase
VSGGKIVVMGTGGTLAGRAAQAHDNVGYSAAQVGIAELLRGIPALAGRELATEQVAQVDSKDMDLEVWRQLALRCAHWLAQPEVAGLVITHGTDTLEETAFFLHCVLAPAKPVVLTGGMRPSTAFTPDGPQNIADAVALASHPGAAGVMVAFAGTVHGAADVVKVHTYRLDAFSSGDAGPVGHMEEGAVRQLRAWPRGDEGCAAASLRKLAAGAAWPPVEIVMNHAGAGRTVVDALVQRGVRGLVAAGTGNGTLHRALQAALLDAQAAGVRVLRASRCAQGMVIGHAGDPLPHAAGLSPVKARIALMLELMA